ncbi:MAG TPA: GspH/FimT family pseudopilin [Gemmatimonadales bacterium]|nr:GspH/FimT family pseudopilin [Gemmatimonadales bacterium]
MRPRGVTLIELLLVLGILGIMALMAAPRLGSLRNRAALRISLGVLLESLDAARGAAVRLGGGITLAEESGHLVIRADTALLRSWPEPGRSGVNLSGLATPIRFGPAGLATGASNRTLRLSRGGDTLSVVLSRLGRIRTDQSP